MVAPIEETETASGIILPEAAKEKPQRGTVLAVGPGRVLQGGERAPMDVKEGEKVIFKSYAPDEFKIAGETVFVLEDTDIIAVID